MVHSHIKRVAAIPTNKVRLLYIYMETTGAKPALGPNCMISYALGPNCMIPYMVSFSSDPKRAYSPLWWKRKTSRGSEQVIRHPPLNNKTRGPPSAPEQIEEKAKKKSQRKSRTDLELRTVYYLITTCRFSHCYSEIPFSKYSKYVYVHNKHLGHPSLLVL